MFSLNIKRLTGLGLRVFLLASVLNAVVLADGYAPVQDASRVALFSQPFCPGCEAAKHYFHERDVVYLEFDISASAKARDTFERLGGRGTPLLLIDGKRVHGFSVPVIEQRLIQAGRLEENQ